MQTKRMSLIETILGTCIGFTVALITQLIVFPAFGIHTAPQENFLIAGIFTAVSVIRGYFVRRLFNWLGLRKRGLG